MASIPEIALLVAVIERALRDVVGDGVLEQEKEKVGGEALRWFFNDSKEPFSFEWVCEQLDWSADAIRAWIRAWIRKEEIKLSGIGEREACGECQRVFF